MKNMKICISDELKKIKDYLDKNITLISQIVPNFDKGNKISIPCYKMIDEKMTKFEYSFFIEYYEDRDNYKNAPYLIHCHTSYNLGGSGYADKYESIEDFINASLTRELLEKYGRNKKVEKVQTEELTLFDDNTEDIEDEEIISDNQMSIFDLENDTQDNQLSLSFEINNQSDPVEDLLSYGIDDYYIENLSTGCPLLSAIHDELSKLPNYKEYYGKLKTYLEGKLPVVDIKDADFKKNRYMFINDNIITVKYDRQQCPIYCYKMFEKML